MSVRSRRRADIAFFSGFFAALVDAEPTDLSPDLVPRAGLEPARLSATVFETVVSAISPPGQEVS